MSDIVVNIVTVVINFLHSYFLGHHWPNFKQSILGSLLVGKYWFSSLLQYVQKNMVFFQYQFIGKYTYVLGLTEFGIQIPLIKYIVRLVSSQLVIWPTRNQVNLYPGSPLVTTMDKSTHNQSLGYELPYQQLLMKTHTQTYSLSRYLWLYLYSATSICS